ncbi:MAG: metallophosphoesterase family protein [Promethearchaeota archaeon]
MSKTVIGILSDTHLLDIDLKSPQYPKFLNQLHQIFEGVDHLIHAGDICTEKFLLNLEKIAPISFCRGNTDPIKRWPRKLQLQFGGINIGIAHAPEDYILFDPAEIQVFIHGHTHIPENRESPDGVMILCPGSILNPRPTLRMGKYFENSDPKPSVAFLTIEDGIVSAIIKTF